MRLEGRPVMCNAEGIAKAIPYGKATLEERTLISQLKIRVCQKTLTRQICRESWNNQRQFFQRRNAEIVRKQ